MLTIYRDSEQVIHFARESIVDGRLIPMPAPNLVFHETPEQAMYEGFWFKPTQKSQGKSADEVVQQAANRMFKLRAPFDTIGWDVQYRMRPAWETYKRIAEYQNNHTYVEAPEKMEVDMWALIRQLYAVFTKTRKGFHSDRELHPAVNLMLEKFGAPANLAVLVSEQPTLPQEAAEVQSVSYYQNLAKMEKAIKTKTKLGKYLRRHWPAASDTEIRDMTQRFAPVQFAIWDTTPEMIKAAQLGPQTCMKDSDFNMTEHPYVAYKPEFGWAVAVTFKGELIVGRAVVNKDRKIFVRSFKAHNDDPSSREYSYDDDRLEVWLTDQGYNRLGRWPDGLKLAKIRQEDNDNYVWLPYIDGSNQKVNDCGSYLELDYYGEYSADHACGYREFNNNGDGDENEDDDRTLCEICDERSDSSGMNYHEVRQTHENSAYHRDICDCCLENYVRVRGTAGDSSRYWVHESEAIEVCGEALDEENLPEGYVKLNSGEVISADDAICIDSTGDYVAAEDAVLVTNGDGHEEWAERDDCSECEHDGKWYKDEDICIFRGNVVASVNLETWFEDQDDQDEIIACINNLLATEPLVHTDRAVAILQNWFNDAEISGILNNTVETVGA